MPGLPLGRIPDEHAKLLADDRQHFADILGRAACVDVEDPRLAVPQMPGRDRVRQASLLSDLLEQPGRHPAPEDHVEQPQRPAPSVRARDPLGSVDEVRLLDVAFVHDETPRHRRRRAGRADRARR